MNNRSRGSWCTSTFTLDVGDSTDVSDGSLTDQARRGLV